MGRSALLRYRLTCRRENPIRGKISLQDRPSLMMVPRRDSIHLDKVLALLGQPKSVKWLNHLSGVWFSLLLTGKRVRRTLRFLGNPYLLRDKRIRKVFARSLMTCAPPPLREGWVPRQDDWLNQRLRPTRPVNRDVHRPDLKGPTGTGVRPLCGHLSRKEGETLEEFLDRQIDWLCQNG